MASLNQCNFIGNIGKIETRYMSNGKPVTNLSIACNDSWRDKATGEKKERAEWIDIVMYDKLSEIAEKYLTKGKQIYVSGRMQTSSWEANDIKRYRTEIIANELKMLGSKSAQESKPDQENMQDKYRNCFIGREGLKDKYSLQQ